MPSIRNNPFVLLLACLSLSARGQSYRYRTDIGPVLQKGFYSLALTPEISRYLKADFTDLRIVDEKGDTIPFIIKRRVSLVQSPGFSSFPILVNRLTDSGQSMIIVQNQNQEKTGALLLNMKNASVSRMVNLSGSDDNTNWFSIRENIPLMNGYAVKEDTYFETIEIPLSSYKYFKFMIANGKNDPLNILGVGIMRRFLQAESLYLDNPRMQYQQHDSSDHASYITVSNPSQFHIDFVRIKLRGPKFFKREVSLSGPTEIFGHFVISSDSIFNLYVPEFKDSLWKIRITNGDNPPLEIQAVQTGQESRKAIAYFRDGGNYSIYLGNRQAPTPNYDLQEFRDSIPYDAPELKLSQIEEVRAIVGPTRPIYFKQAWLWPVILIALAAMGFFTYRLTREVSGNK